MEIALKHLSVKRDKVSHVSYPFTAIYCQLSSLSNCEVIVFLFATVLYYKLRQVLQTTAKVRQQFIRRIKFFSFSLSNQKRVGKLV